MAVDDPATPEASPHETPAPTEDAREPKNRKKLPFVLVGVLAGAAVLAALVTGGTYLYINVFSDDAPEELSLNRDTPAEPATAEPAGDPAVGTEGTWTVAEGSVAGYRVDEILFGQHKTVVGRTSKVTGEMTITGTAVESASFTVDMASVTTDSGNRDGQYRGRIMDVATYPTSMFELTGPIGLAPLPEGSTARSYPAVGELTLRGNTRPVTMDLETQRVGDQIDVVGSLPVVFADYGIPNPSIPGISVEDNGVMEIHLVLAMAR